VDRDVPRQRITFEMHRRGGRFAVERTERR
jgi:hypothetical protein